LYHGTLRNTEDEFCSELENSTRDFLDYISVGNLDAALSMLHELGKVNEANTLFEEFTEKRKNFVREFNESTSSDRAKFEPLQDAMEKNAIEEAEDNRGIGDVVDSAVSDDFIMQADRKRLADFSAQDFVDYFTSTDQSHLTSKMRFIRDQSIRGSDDFDKKIYRAISQAAEIVAAQNRLNKFRMESMGLVERQAPNDKT